MSFFEMDSEQSKDKKEIVFLYKLKKGICETSFGLNVARLAFGNFGSAIIDNAEKKAHIFESTVIKKQNLSQFTFILKNLKEGNVSFLKEYF